MTDTKHTTGKRILIMMSVFNGEKYLDAQIESILNQKTELDVHLRIRDDGSEDSSPEIISRYAEKYPAVITAEYGDNLGVNKSYLKLLSEAEDHDFYAFSDQDDVWLEGKLQTAIGSFPSDPELPVLYSSASYIVRGDLKPVGTTRLQKKPFTLFNTLVQNICCGHNQVFNRALMQKIRQSDAPPENIFVYDSWVENVAMIYGEIIFNNEPQTLYRQHEGNKMGYGTNAVSQLLKSIVHVHSGNAHACCEQARQFAAAFENRLKELGYYGFVCAFTDPGSFLQRIRFLGKYKIYRQNAIETFAVRCAFLMGFFK